MNLFGDELSVETDLNATVASKELTKELQDGSFRFLCENAVKDLDEGILPEFFSQKMCVLLYQYACAVHKVSEILDLEASELKYYSLASSLSTLYGKRNDVSFIDKDASIVFFYECQSTPSDKMALRCLMYYMHIVDKYIADNGFNLYSMTPSVTDAEDLHRHRIPMPEFYVFYIEGYTLPTSDLSSVWQGKKSEFLCAKTLNVDISFGVLTQAYNKELLDAIADAYGLHIERDSLLSYSRFMQHLHTYRKEVILETYKKVLTYYKLPLDTDLKSELFKTLKQQNKKYIDITVGEELSKKALGLLSKEVFYTNSVFSKREVISMFSAYTTSEEFINKLKALELEDIKRDIKAQVTEEVTAQVTEEVTAQVTEEVTAQVTEEVKAQVTEEVTAQVTEEVTDGLLAAILKNMQRAGSSLDDMMQATGLDKERLTHLLNVLD